MSFYLQSFSVLIIFTNTSYKIIVIQDTIILYVLNFGDKLTIFISIWYIYILFVVSLSNYIMPFYYQRIFETSQLLI